jgi:hypothetical protein
MPTQNSRNHGSSDDVTSRLRLLRDLESGDSIASIAQIAISKPFPCGLIILERPCIVHGLCVLTVASGCVRKTPRAPSFILTRG